MPASQASPAAMWVSCAATRPADRAASLSVADNLHTAVWPQCRGSQSDNMNICQGRAASLCRQAPSPYRPLLRDARLASSL